MWLPACCRLTLDQTKKKILSNLQVLEEAGMCSKEFGYQSLLNAVAQDIRNQRIYRKQRKQDLQKLKHTLDELELKKVQQEEAIDYYDQYVKECMKRMGKTSSSKYAACVCVCVCACACVCVRVCVCVCGD